MDTPNRPWTTGIPTRHKERVYRSRLEARWATFFDMLEWKYEYEPFDLDGWIPDFLLPGVVPVLVEIKPVYEFPGEVAKRIDDVRNADGFDVLIGGCMVPPRQRFAEGASDGTPLGWLRTNLHEEQRRSETWGLGVAYRFAEGGPIGLYHEFDRHRWDVGRNAGINETEVDRLTGNRDGIRFWELPPGQIEGFWQRAANAVQWRAPRQGGN